VSIILGKEEVNNDMSFLVGFPGKNKSRAEGTARKRVDDGKEGHIKSESISRLPKQERDLKCYGKSYRQEGRLESKR
jgi:hypothetical protein